jgi:CubicO group peptidase (beta-lactamase class C family)
MRMRWFPRYTTSALTLFALCAAAVATLVAQSTPASAPRAGQASRPAAPREAVRAGFSVERLRRVDALLQRYVDENRVAGAVALVLRDGQPAYEKAVGWADRESNRRMAADTIFRIASQTKAITSVGILMLVEEGLIGIGDPVSRFIPAYAKTTVSVKGDGGSATVPAKRPITIKDLLTHTAGISYGREADIASLYEAKGLGPAAGFGWYTADKSEGVCDTMERLASLPFAAQPGEAWVYGYNTDILGCVIEKVSGMPLDSYLRSRILDPLGMKDTAFFLPPDKRNRLAAVYRTEDGKLVRAPDGPRGQGNYVEGPRRNFAGGAGLLSTIGDYGRFLEMIRNGGTLDGVRILAPRTVALMTHNQIGTLHSPNGLGFGLGFQTTDLIGANGLDPKGAYGWAGAYGSMYRVDPSAGIAMLLMIQMLPQTTDLAPRYFTAVHQAFVQDTAGARLRSSASEFQQ